jgi:ribosomal protein L37AE/L43A
MPVRFGRCIGRTFASLRGNLHCCHKQTGDEHAPGFFTSPMPIFTAIVNIMVGVYFPLYQQLRCMLQGGRARRAFHASSGYRSSISQSDARHRRLHRPRRRQLSPELKILPHTHHRGKTTTMNYGTRGRDTIRLSMVVGHVEQKLYHCPYCGQNTPHPRGAIWDKLLSSRMTCQECGREFLIVDDIPMTEGGVTRAVQYAALSPSPSALGSHGEADLPRSAAGLTERSEG